MADATNFIPNEAELDVSEAYFSEDVTNHASDEEIADNLRGAVQDYETRFDSQREKWSNPSGGIWNLCDWAFRSCLNDAVAQSEKAVGDNKPSDTERAKTGTTQFFRQVVQKASNLYAVMTSKDIPFKYESVHGDDGKDEHAEALAERKNLLAKWTMKRDRFVLKALEFATQVFKYGNVPVSVEWHQRRGVSKFPFPVYDTENPDVITEYRNIERETVVENRPRLSILPVDSVKCDTTIGDIASQECVIVVSVVGLREIVDGIRTGLYREDMLALLSPTHQWDGTSGFDSKDTKDLNRGSAISSPVRSGSGRYLKREVFINIPLDDESGKWDEAKIIPSRYRATLFGNQPSDSIVARIERNQEPDDAIPIEMIHAYPDDSDYLYHISPFEVIRSNISTETTLIRQVIDNNTMVNCARPWVKEGAVRTRDLRLVSSLPPIEMDDKDSMGFFQVRDISQPTLGVLQYLKDDSNTAQSMDKNMVGESYGARTSAQEAGTIAASSSRPNLVNIEYILEQFLGFYAKRLDVLWPAYARNDQMVQITDERDTHVYIKPKEITGEFDIVIDIVDEIKDNEMKAQRMLNYAQVAAGIPGLSQTVDWKGLNKELQEYMMGTSKYVVDGGDGDAEDAARRNVLLMLQAGQYPQLPPNANLKKHLEIYENELLRNDGAENPNLAILEHVVAQIKQRMQAAAIQPQQGLQAPQAESVQGGQMLSAMQGALQG